MCEDLHCCSHFLFQFDDILISLFNLFIQIHIVNLKLFKVYHVKAFSQLILEVGGYLTTWWGRVNTLAFSFSCVSSF